LPQDQTGNRLPSQPKHKVAMTLIHDKPLAAGSSLSFVGTWAYNGSMYPTIGNVGLYEIPSYSRFDASARWTSKDQIMSVQLYVNNLLDEIGLNEFVASGGFGGQVFLGSPNNHREIGLTFRYSPDLTR